jgi:hypothetical protein
MSSIRVNPRALRTATVKAIAAGALTRDFEAYDTDTQRAILAQAEVLIRAYAAAKDDDLSQRRGHKPGGGPEEGDLL